MKWIEDFQLFLFDFDGLLVNTEEIHYQAYRKMCLDRGFDLLWDFSKYCFMAHYNATKLRAALYETIPGLYEMEPNWDILYGEKKKAMVDLLNKGAVHLMPGAEALLLALEKKGIPRCVVTNSPDEQIDIIRGYNPVLNTIPNWFTRETYSHPKPHPECYLNAISKLGAGAEKIIGFEDTPRGLTALLETPATPVLVSQVRYPEIAGFLDQGVHYFSSLEELPENSLG